MQGLHDPRHGGILLRETYKRYPCARYLDLTHSVWTPSNPHEIRSSTKFSRASRPVSTLTKHRDCECDNLVGTAVTCIEDFRDAARAAFCALHVLIRAG
jgi:hypothetical protein